MDTARAEAETEEARLRAARWSVLDRALIRRGQPPGETLRETVAFARQAEALGAHRFWVAEHHGVPGVAGSAPTVLAAAVGAATSRIRVGTGGVMLPNHRPLVVAEQFGVLESLFPGRVDMGLGRSVGFTGAVRAALGAEKEAADAFGEQLTELLGYFAGGGPVRALPAEGLRVPAFVLAVGSGADLAAERGLPLVMAHLADERRMLDTLDRYRSRFVPSEHSAHGERPYVIVAVNAAVGATREEAALLQIPEAWATAVSRTQGVFPPLDPPGEVLAREMSERERRYFEEARAGHLHGDEAQTRRTLAGLLERTGADELLVTLNAHSAAGRLDSYRRLARIAGLTGARPGPEAGTSGPGRPEWSRGAGRPRPAVRAAGAA
ncbi:LLM class flavin-dependent oxidoreductase [Streptomyces sp. DSM 44917]|uniref:LLM class flavin-dependent oxidoreductase n=1 Tax=Streptomyces boetiae TaxID=3075541 RepID=A0ABU2LB15_9ACTN|nr:LLM class flavin-dependent oxidoreductase [Streptomyces sp. DSM 44917]MDT0308712.1 LLM class flavin-dependent oxidoreductase [Streptomyces sp. DSM 44917]